MSSDDLNAYRDEAVAALDRVATGEALDEWHRAHLGHSGKIRQLRKQIGSQPADQRREFGRVVNDLAKDLETRFGEVKQRVAESEMQNRVQAEKIDVTLPSRARRNGRAHPISAMLQEICEVFGHLGFEVYESPHVETDAYNFELLNIPQDHPARDMQDTFYVSDDVLLRTHTSAGQIRAMQEYRPQPMRVLLPGLCYRNEEITTRSEIQFHQVEGLVVGPDVKMSDLKGILMYFAKQVFGHDQAVRFRGSYFPFTEPSVEVDIHCTLCHGKGCRLCKYTGWLELLGAGLVHPTVLKNGGYDPDEVRGIAFGMGVERIVMIRHGISDIRCFYRNDQRWLGQFQ